MKGIIASIKANPALAFAIVVVVVALGYYFVKRSEERRVG